MDSSVRRLGYLFALFFAFCIWTPREARCAIYNVDNASSCSDSWSGTEYAPWCTIQHAADVVSAGDTVYVKPGKYDERVIIKKSGLSGSPITFRSEQSNKAVCKGFSITGSYINIDAFNILNISSQRTAGIYCKGNYTSITNNYMEYIPFAGVYSDGSGNSIMNNYMLMCQYGIIFNGSGCTVSHNEVNGLKKWDSSEDNDYIRFFGSDHTIHGNYLHSMELDDIGSSHVDCFQTFDNNGLFANNVTIENNICSDMHQGAMLQGENHHKSSDIIFKNNVFSNSHAWGLCIGDIPNIQVHNNTFANIQYHGIGCDNSCTIRNNIFYNTGTGYWGKSVVVSDHNLLYKEGGHYEPSRFPGDIVNVDPGFTDPSGSSVRANVGTVSGRDGEESRSYPDAEAESDYPGVRRSMSRDGADGDVRSLRAGSFRLKADLPCIDAGSSDGGPPGDIAGTPRPQGSGHDIGAFEYSDPTIWSDFFAVDTRETPMTGDFNGDGKSDVITFTRDNPNAVGDVYVALSDGSRFGNSVKWNDWFAVNPDEKVVVGDFNGDHIDDIATWLVKTTKQVYVATSYGSGMNASQLRLDAVGESDDDVIKAGDVNGDGYCDIVAFSRRRGKVYAALSDGNGFRSPEVWHHFFAVNTFERPEVGDVDGDGKADIITFATDSPTARGDVYVALSTGTRFSDGYSSTKWSDWFAVDPGQAVRTADIDGDGLSDFAAFLPSPNNQVYVVYSRGFEMSENRLAASGFPSGPTDLPFTADFNGDGKADLVVFRQGEGKVYVQLTP